MRRIMLSPSVAGLCAYLLLSLAILWKNGMYHPVALALALAGFICISAMLAALKHDTHPPVTLAAAVLGILLCVQSFTEPGIYLESDRYDLLFWLLTLVLAPVIASAYIIPGVRHSAVRRFVFLAALSIGLLFTLGMPVASPDPQIDVFAMLQTSASALMNGQNPYVTQIPDVYRGLNGPPLPGLVYPPGSIWLLTPFYGILHDVRFGMIAGLVLTLAAVWKLGGLRFNMQSNAHDDRTAWAELLALLLLWHPRGLFVIEQAWIDPLIVGLLSASLLFRGKQDTVSAGFYGWMLSCKQYLLFFAPLFFLLEKRPKKWLASGLIAFFTIVPFLLWNAAAFWNHGVVFQLADTFRPDALTVPAFLWGFTGWEPGRSLSLIIGILAAVIAIPLTRPMRQPAGFLLAAAFIHYAVFLFGSQGFANYYWLVCALLILTLAASSKAPQTTD